MQHPDSSVDFSVVTRSVVTRSPQRGVTPSLGAIATVVGLSLNLAIAVPSQAAMLTWDTTFWDTQGASVGQGQFTIDTENSYPVQVLPDYATNSSINVTNYVTAFTANVQGRDWTVRSAWLNDAGKTEGVSVVARYGIYTRSERWTGDDFGLGNYYNWMTGQKVGSDRIEGNWSQYFLRSVPPGTNPVFFGEGSWTATLRSADGVPEPTTMAGLLAASGMSVWLRRKQRNLDAN